MTARTVMQYAVTQDSARPGVSLGSTSRGARQLYRNSE